MSGESFSGVVKFVAGAVIGAVALAIYHQTTPQPPTTRPLITPASGQITASVHPSTETAHRLDSLTQRLEHYSRLTAQLQDQLDRLHQRLVTLESQPSPLSVVTTPPTVETPDSAGETDPTPSEAKQAADIKPLTVASLMEAGIDQHQAEYIVRRQGELEMQRLELRDQAIRDGTLGSNSYLSAMRELNRNSAGWRDEVNDDVYDRYLYATGQRNRVVVSSVISGSAADQAGIREGDMILGYGESRIFSWPELRKATTEGYRGEYVTVNVQRGQRRLSLLLPRGPLGVRLSTGSKPPLEQGGY